MTLAAVSTLSHRLACRLLGHRPPEVVDLEVVDWVRSLTITAPCLRCWQPVPQRFDFPTQSTP